jgi:cyclic pyranopterin phosphate synthase
MPQSRFSWIPPQEVLSYEEIIRLLKLMAGLGIKKVRLTGGEPLIRRDILSLVREIQAIDGIEKLCITTNGVLLPGLARQLYELGLRHVNISLDTLRPELFRQLTGRDHFSDVWSGIMECIRLGFRPIKINAVMMRGKNHQELPDLAALVLKYPVEVRFIEFMPVGNESRWESSYFIPSSEAARMIEDRLGPLEPLRQEHMGPARLFRVSGGMGAIGFINPMSHNFCSSCNRIRITSDGRMRLCLFSDNEIDLKSLLRSEASDQEISDFIKDAVKRKPESYAKIDKDSHPSCRRKMSSIGG